MSHKPVTVYSVSVLKKHTQTKNKKRNKQNMLAFYLTRSRHVFGVSATYMAVTVKLVLFFSHFYLLSDPQKYSPDDGRQ